MNREIIEISNGQIITPGGIITNGSILIKDGKIIEVSDRLSGISDVLSINARGEYVSPGFIDLHVHGGGGSDFMDGDVQSFLTVAATHARFGTTSLMPTTLTSKKKDLITTFENYKKAISLNKSGAQFIGLHLEGPYFAMEQRGAQDPRYIRDPDPEEYNELLSSFGHLIRRWTAAPELPGAIEFVRQLKKYGILASIGHTDAVYDDAVKAFDNGYTLVTHLYSGMLGVTRRNAFRYAGMVESAFLIDEMDVEAIADGIHLPPPLLRLIYKNKGAEHIALVTDAMRGAGMPEGESILGGEKTGLKVIIEDGVAKLPDRSSFAGSVATTDRLLRTMVQQAKIPLIESVKMMTETPARIAGINNKKGSLVIGKDADIIIFDDQITIGKTLVGGKIIYEKE